MADFLKKVISQNENLFIIQIVIAFSFIIQELQKLHFVLGIYFHFVNISIIFIKKINPDSEFQEFKFETRREIVNMVGSTPNCVQCFEI